ncbi:MAG: STAS domain-containing protein [Syntrophaceae bacterium]|nr:STAS domain-containing protein [Syntrophaceae bacterium]
MPDIVVGVSYAADDESIAILTVSGFVAQDTFSELDKKLEEQLSLNKYKIIVNLENTEYVSSAGWGVFISEIKEIRENNGDLLLANMTPNVYEVYEVMEFSSILKSFVSLDEAIAYFSGDSGETSGALKPAIEKPTPKSEPIPARAYPPSMETGKQEKVPQPRPSVQPEQAPASEKEPDIYSRATSELGKRIIDIIVDNPYAEPKEISRALKLPQYGGEKVKVGAVKKELKAMGLFDRQQRFELAMKSGG